MARPRKAKSKPAEKLSEALNFVAPAFKEGGLPFQAHARLAGNMIVATDGTLTAGHAVEEELALCPHIGRLIDALNRAGTTLALTENENGTLLVKGDKIRATVPCIPGGDLPQVMPDPKVAAIDDRIKEGFAKLLPLVKKEAERVIEVSLLLRANSMFSCNGMVIFEYWHGIDLPPGLVIPKTFADAVVATSKKLEGFGFSAKSVTFYFEDGSWYKTQQYEEEWPNVDQLFDRPQYPAVVPEGLFEAVAAIESFSRDGLVHFHDEKLKSTYDRYQDNGGPIYGATYDVPGLQAGHSFTAKLLRLIEPVVKSFDYTSNDDRAYFFDEANVRGCIMKRSMGASDPAPPPGAATWQEASGDQVAAEMAAAREAPQEAATGAAGGGWGSLPPSGSPLPPEAATANPNASVWGAVTGGGYPIDDLDEDIPF